MDKRPLIVHLIYRLDFGGLEMLLVECVNRMPADRFRHAIVCLTDYTDFSKKIARADVELFALHKPPGLGLGMHLKIWTLLRRLKPAVLHTYNLGAIEYTVAAALAGVPVRVHAEHGRDASDPEGKNPKHNLLRRLVSPFIDYFIPVSADLQGWLRNTIGIPERKNRLVNNGVDTDKFRASKDKPDGILPWPDARDCFVIGTVGRIQDVKNHAGLVDAFIELCAQYPQQRAKLRLAIVGDGPMLARLKQKVRDAGIDELVWLPGARSDIERILQTFSVFAMTSIAEGTPVVLLEAMSSSLPVVATRVGGIPEVVADGHTGTLVTSGDMHAFAQALGRYLDQPQLMTAHGAAGRERIEQRYSMTAMLQSYTELYEGLCATKLNWSGSA